jgi:hypothetical protein
MRTAHSPVSQNRRGSAPTEGWRYRAEAGKLPGRASRGCAVSLATLKQASCGVVPGARPLAVPGRFGSPPFRRDGKFWKDPRMFDAGAEGLPSSNFPWDFRVPRSGLPRPARSGNPKGWRGLHFPCADLPAGMEGESAPIAARRFQTMPGSMVGAPAPSLQGCFLRIHCDRICFLLQIRSISDRMGGSRASHVNGAHGSPKENQASRYVYR